MKIKILKRTLSPEDIRTLQGMPEESYHLGHEVFSDRWHWCGYHRSTISEYDANLIKQIKGKVWIYSHTHNAYGRRRDRWQVSDELNELLQIYERTEEDG